METKYQIFGMDEYESVIEDSLKKHDLYKERFAFQMLLTEGMTNAYRHGNQCDDRKSIDIKVESDVDFTHKKVRICIVDSGAISHDFSNDVVIEEGQLLNEHGRGLFLIEHYSDEVEVIDNALYIYKEIKEDEG